MKLEINWKIDEMSGLLDIDLMLVSAFGVNIQGIVLLLIYGWSLILNQTIDTIIFIKYIK